MSPPQLPPLRRILVIDDNESIHEDFRKLFASCAPQRGPGDELAALILDEQPPEPASVAFEVECAFSGEAGLAQLQEAEKQGRPFSVAFVDVRLPTGWDGLETTERFWREDPNVQVILCTAYSTYSWRDLTARFPGCDRLVILKKPFDAAEALQLATALSEKWQLEQESRQRLADLEKSIGDEQENRALAEAQFSAVLAERNRMAREIHDTLAQGFAAIFVQLEVAKDALPADPEVARKHVDRAHELARESLEQARRTIWNIRSRALETTDLAGALAEIGKLLTTDTSAEFSLRIDGIPRRLSELVENNLLRIGQEAITNAMKHSDAKSIVARLDFRPDSVCLEIRDDGEGGAGSTNNERNTGFGLRGMEERAKEMRAELTIQSLIGQGTLVSITVPVSETP
ncbi:MAG TPA: histidine kinase [Chthoniobacteraceae bacterium]